MWMRSFEEAELLGGVGSHLLGGVVEHQGLHLAGVEQHLPDGLFPHLGLHVPHHQVQTLAQHLEVGLVPDVEQPQLGVDLLDVALDQLVLLVVVPDRHQHQVVVRVREIALRKGAALPPGELAGPQFLLVGLQDGVGGRTVELPFEVGWLAAAVVRYLQVGLAPLRPLHQNAEGVAAGTHRPRVSLHGLNLIAAFGHVPANEPASAVLVLRARQPLVRLHNLDEASGTLIHCQLYYAVEFRAVHYLDRAVVGLKKRVHAHQLLHGGVRHFLPPARSEHHNPLLVATQHSVDVLWGHLTLLGAEDCAHQLATGQLIHLFPLPLGVKGFGGCSGELVEDVADVSREVHVLAVGTERFDISLFNQDRPKLELGPFGAGGPVVAQLVCRKH